MNHIEALCIRLLHILHALRPIKTPGLCPPQCSESHTYRFPCRARIKPLRISKQKAKQYKYLD